MPSQDKRQRKKENARLAREARIAAERRRRRLRSARNIGIIVAIFVIFIVVVNIVKGDNKKPSSKASPTPTTTTPVTVDPTKTYVAAITTNLGKIELALDVKKSPIAASHFIQLARDGVYNGSRWHRVVKDYVIQGGAPGGDPNKDYGTSVVGELPTNHYPVGSLAAAKKDNDPPGTFDSQFFIVTGKQQGAGLSNDYARFGSVKSGMDVVRKIEALPTDSKEEPTQKATIDNVTINES